MTSRCSIIGMKCSHFFFSFPGNGGEAMAEKDSRHNVCLVSVERGPLVSDNILSTIS